MRKNLNYMKSTKIKYMNGAICGGVISKSLFHSNPGAYMMSYFMEDKIFARYKKSKKKGDKFGQDNKYDKEAKKLFDKYAYSAI